MKKDKKILIIDDNPAITDSMRLLLDFEGYDVSTLSKGSEVFKFLKVEWPSLIVLDMWLSGEDGRDICRKLKSKDGTKNIPIIMMSASRGLEQSALEAGADAFIAKPFDMDDMLVRISELLQQ